MRYLDTRLLERSSGSDLAISKDRGKKEKKKPKEFKFPHSLTKWEETSCNRKRKWTERQNESGITFQCSITFIYMCSRSRCFKEDIWGHWQCCWNPRWPMEQVEISIHEDGALKVAHRWDLGYERKHRSETRAVNILPMFLSEPRHVRL